MASTTGSVAGAVPETPVRAPDGALPASLTELAALEAARDEKRSLLEPAAEVIGHDPAELAGLALGHLELAGVRPQGSATIDVERLPGGAGGGAGGSRAVVRIITDDMPFLVDSVTAEVVRQGIELRHVVHPIVVVRRGVTGRIQAFCDSADAATCGPDALSESWMAVVLDGPLDDEGTADLISGLRTVLADVR